MSTRVVNSARWSLVTNVGSQALQFLFSTALARLLSPKDFGIIAATTIFSGFAAIIFEFGLGQSLVHLRHPTERHRSTVFWANALSGVVYFIIMCSLGPVLQSFFAAPGLQIVLPIIASGVLFNLNAVGYAILQKGLQFKSIALITLSSTLIGQFISVGVAVFDRSPVAIAISAPVTSVLSTAMYFARVRWFPRHFIDLHCLRELWAFSGGLLGSQIVLYWSGNVDNLIIGRRLGAEPLAIYNRAFNLMTVPVTQVGSALSVVFFPALSSIRDDLARLRTAHLRSLRIIGLIMLPVIAVLATTAPALIQVLFGPQWAAAAPILEILAFTGAFRVVCQTSNWLLQARGFTTSVMRNSLIVLALTVVGVLLGVHFGTRGVAVGILAANAAATPFVVRRAVTGTASRVGDIARCFLVPAAGSAATWVVGWFAPRLLHWDLVDFKVLVVQVVLSLATYSGFTLIFNRSVARDFMSAVRPVTPVRQPVDG